MRSSTRSLSALQGTPAVSLPLDEKHFKQALAEIASAGQLMASSRPLEAYLAINSVKYAGSLGIPGAGFIEGIALLEMGHVTEARAAIGLEVLNHPETIEAANIAKSIDEGISWKSCAIVTGESHDPAVFYNLMTFYADLGFLCFATKTPQPADLMVVMGGEGAMRLEFSGLPKNTPVHLFEYSAVSSSKLLKALKGFPVTVFAVSEKLLSHAQGVRAEILLPPVATSLWTRMGPRFIPFVHIGDSAVKKGQKTWPAFDELQTALAQSDVFLWGRDWEKFPGIRNWVGETEVYGIADIYGKANFALGLFSPAQQELGVLPPGFWQAPLAGCSVICQQVSGALPAGIFPWGLKDGLARARNEKPDPISIQKAAIAFWLRQWDEARARVSQALAEMPALETHKLPSVSSAWITCASLRSMLVGE